MALDSLWRDRIPVSGISGPMIRSFGDKRTEVLFRHERVRQFEGIARAAKRKLEALSAASRLEDLTVRGQTGWRSSRAT
jgi:plasmid maintenance system killer protein